MSLRTAKFVLRDSNPLTTWTIEQHPDGRIILRSSEKEVIVPEASASPHADSARVKSNTARAVRTLLQCLDSTDPSSHSDRAFIQEIFQRLVGLRSVHNVRDWIEEYDHVNSQQNPTSTSPGGVNQESKKPRATFTTTPQNPRPGFRRPPAEPMVSPNRRPRKRLNPRKWSSKLETTETPVPTMSTSRSMNPNAQCTIEELKNSNSTSLIMKNIPLLPPGARVVYGPNAVEVRDRVRAAIALLGEEEVVRIEKIADETVTTDVSTEEAFQYCKQILEGVDKDTAVRKCIIVRNTSDKRKEIGTERLEKFYDDLLNSEARQDQRQSSSPRLAPTPKSALRLRRFQDIEEEGDEAARADHAKRQRFRSRDGSLGDDDIDISFLQDAEMREPNADELQELRDEGSRSPTLNPISRPGVERRQLDDEPTEEIVAHPHAFVQPSETGLRQPATGDNDEDSELLEQLTKTVDGLQRFQSRKIVADRKIEEERKAAEKERAAMDAIKKAQELAEISCAEKDARIRHLEKQLQDGRQTIGALQLVADNRQAQIQMLRAEMARITERVKAKLGGRVEEWFWQDD